MPIDLDGVKAINKKYALSKESPVVLRGDQAPPQPVSWVTSGCASVDLAFGQGVPRGRVLELYGPPSGGKTALAVSLARSVQDAGGEVLYIDAEYAMNPTWRAGLDQAKLFWCEPEYGEQAWDIAGEFITQGIDLVVVDSIATLTPRAEAEASMEEQQRGALARMMGKAMRTIAPLVFKSGAILVCVNQIRSGMSQYCFHAETPITFADGTTHTVKEVVEKRLTGPVLSYDQGTGAIVQSEIVDWYTNGKTDKWVTVRLSSSGGANGVMSFTATPNHQVLTAAGFRAVGDLQENDTMFSWYTSTIAHNDFYQQIIAGSMLGDGGITCTRDSTASFKLANREQPEYLDWKLRKLKALGFRTTTCQGRTQYISRSLTELTVLRDQFYPNGQGFRTFPETLELTPLSAAVWFMDDGHYGGERYLQASICIKRLFKYEGAAEKAAAALRRFIGCGHADITLDQRSKSLIIRRNVFRQFCALICQFVPEPMQYKLLSEFRGKYEDFDSGDLTTTTTEVFPVRVIAVGDAQRRKYRDRVRYDIQVADSHCYFAGGGQRGVVVHNSPEVRPGGKSLPYSASLCAKVSRDELLKDGTTAIGQKVRVEVTKNKVASPGKTGYFTVYYEGPNAGIDRLQGLLDAGEQLGLIQKKGPYIYLGGETLGQGAEKAKAALRDNVTLRDSLSAAVQAGMEEKGTK